MVQSLMGHRRAEDKKCRVKSLLVFSTRLCNLPEAVDYVL